MLKADYYIAPTEIDLLVFEKLLSPDHYLRQVKEAIDFEPMRQLVADCYSPDQGRGAEDPVRMLKLHFLEFHYDLSDRDVIREAQVNIAYRFFLDLSLDSLLPVPSLLSQFRTRLGEERFTKVFNEVLRQAREKGLVKDRLRLKDATHVIADIAIPSTIQLVAQTRTQLLEAARPFATEEVTAHLQRADEIRQTTADLKNEQRLCARVEHLREIVCWADAWAAHLEESSQNGAPATSPEQQEAFDQARTLAHKVLNDREKNATDKLVSLVDPEARTGVHGGYFTGYLLDLSPDADSELICAVETLAGNGDEGADAKALIEAEEKAHGNDVEGLSIDSAGFRGEVLHNLTEAEDGPQLEVFVPPYHGPNYSPDLYEAKDFQLNEAGDELTCPGGQTTSNRTRASHNQGWQFRFRKSQCEHCPLRDKCLKPEIQNGRNVIKNDYEKQYQAARAKAETEEYKEVRKQHPAIERKLSEMIRRHGGRRVRYRKRRRVKIQYVLTAVVVNFKRIVKLLNTPLHLQPA
jgi:transposase